MSIPQREHPLIPTTKVAVFGGHPVLSLFRDRWLRADQPVMHISDLSFEDALKLGTALGDLGIPFDCKTGVGNRYDYEVTGVANIHHLESGLHRHRWADTVIARGIQHFNPRGVVALDASKLPAADAFGQAALLNAAIDHKKLIVDTPVTPASLRSEVSNDPSRREIGKCLRNAQQERGV